MQLFNDFLKAQYKEFPYIKDRYGSFKAFRENAAFDSLTVNEWLDHQVKGSELTLKSLASTLKTLTKYNRRDAEYNIYSLTKHYQVRIPVVYGVATNQFWAGKI